MAPISTSFGPPWERWMRMRRRSRVQLRSMSQRAMIIWNRATMCTLGSWLAESQIGNRLLTSLTLSCKIKGARRCSHQICLYHHRGLARLLRANMSTPTLRFYRPPRSPRSKEHQGFRRQTPANGLQHRYGMPAHLPGPRQHTPRIRWCPRVWINRCGRKTRATRSMGGGAQDTKVVDPWI